MYETQKNPEIKKMNISADEKPTLSRWENNLNS
jgi:hypothetical protein